MDSNHVIDVLDGTMVGKVGLNRVIGLGLGNQFNWLGIGIDQKGMGS